MTMHDIERERPHKPNVGAVGAGFCPQMACRSDSMTNDDRRPSDRQAHLPAPSPDWRR